MSRLPETTNRSHLVLLQKKFDDTDCTYKKRDLVHSYAQRLLSIYDQTVHIYNQIVYHIILLGTLIIVAFLVFGHTSMFLSSCLP